MYACFRSSFIASTIKLDGFAVDDVGWGWGEGFAASNFLVFMGCELEGAIGGLMGPGLSSTLALRGAGGIALGLEASLDSDVLVGGVEKEQAGRKNVCE
jgi:hypothetical protein